MKRLANTRGIPVIEDGAQAYLATQGERLVGAIGALSLQQGKHMTTGEGRIPVGEKTGILMDACTVARLGSPVPDRAR